MFWLIPLDLIFHYFFSSNIQSFPIPLYRTKSLYLTHMHKTNSFFSLCGHAVFFLYKVWMQIKKTFWRLCGSTSIPLTLEYIRDVCELHMIWIINLDFSLHSRRPPVHRSNHQLFLCLFLLLFHLVQLNFYSLVSFFFV